MLNNYLTEIISKAEWRKQKTDTSKNSAARLRDNPISNNYRKTVTKNINFKTYKATLPQLKQVMRDLNGGIFKSTLIFDLDDKKPAVKVSKTDSRLIQILKNLDYDVSDESYMLGFVKKKDKTILVSDVLNSLDNKNVESMRQAYEKKPNENMKKQIDSLDEYNRYIKKFKRNIAGYKIASTQKYKVVISIQPRLIASQSTKVGWTSCMNLEEGMNKHFVGQGIAEGVIVAYLVKTGDEHTLESPTARILLKPFKSKDNVLFDIDKTYGTTSDDFRERLFKLLKDHNRYLHGDNLKEGVYKFPNKVYADDIGTTTKVVYAPDSEQAKIMDAIWKILHNPQIPGITKDIYNKILVQDDDFKESVLAEYKVLFKPIDFVNLVKSFKGIYIFSMSFLTTALQRNYLKFLAEKKQHEINDQIFDDILSHIPNSQEKFFVEQLIENDFKFSLENIKLLVEIHSPFIKYFMHLLNTKELVEIIEVESWITNHFPKTFDKLKFLRDAAEHDPNDNLAEDLNLNAKQNKIIIDDILKNKRRSPYIEYIDYAYNVANFKDKEKIDKIA
jgi:hypothetical protein